MATTKSTVKTYSNPDVVDELAAVGVKIPGISSSLPPGKAKDDVYVPPKKTTTTTTQTVVRPTSTQRTKDDVYIPPARTVTPVTPQRVKDDVYIAPAAGSRPSSDPLMNAINKWRASTQPTTQQPIGPKPAPINPWKPTQLIPVGQPMQVGLTGQRPDTGVTPVTGRSVVNPTVTTPTFRTQQPITDRAQDGLVQDRTPVPTPVQQRINAMGLTGETPTTGYTDLAPVGQFFNNVWAAYNDSAAKERMDYTVEQNNRDFQNRTQGGLGEVAQGFGKWVDATVANNAVARQRGRQAGPVNRSPVDRVRCPSRR